MKTIEIIEESIPQELEFIEKCKSIDIVDDETFLKAGELLKQIKLKNKTLKEDRTFLLAPFKTHIRNIEAVFNKVMNPLKDAESVMKIKLLDYQNSQKKEEVVETTEDGLEVTSLTAPVKIEGTTVRKSWTYEVVNDSHIPREFLTVDDKGIKEAIKKGVRDIKGIKIFEKKIMSMRV